MNRRRLAAVVLAAVVIAVPLILVAATAGGREAVWTAAYLGAILLVALLIGVGADAYLRRGAA